MQVKSGSFTPDKTGTVKHTGIPGPVDEKGERQPHGVLVILPDGKVETAEGEAYVPIELSKDGKEVRYNKAEV